VAYIRNQARTARDGQLQLTRGRRHFQNRGLSGRRFQKIHYSLPDLAAAVSVGHKIHSGRAVLKDAALEDFRIRLLATAYLFPLLAPAEVRFHSIGRAPVQVVFRILAIPQFGGNRNNALVLVVSQCDKDVGRSQ